MFLRRLSDPISVSRQVSRDRIEEPLLTPSTGWGRGWNFEMFFDYYTLLSCTHTHSRIYSRAPLLFCSHLLTSIERQAHVLSFPFLFSFLLPKLFLLLRRALYSEELQIREETPLEQPIKMLSKCSRWLWAN